MLALDERPNAADIALERSAHSLELESELVTKARQAVFAAIRRRARAYLRDPLQLEAIHAGLAFAGPECLIATGRTILDNERRFPRRYFGLGGEVAAINARAIMLVGRYQRLVWSAIRRGL